MDLKEGSRFGRYTIDGRFDRVVHAARQQESEREPVPDAEVHAPWTLIEAALESGQTPAAVDAAQRYLHKRDRSPPTR